MKQWQFRYYNADVYEEGDELVAYDEKSGERIASHGTTVGVINAIGEYRLHEGEELDLIQQQVDSARGERPLTADIDFRPSKQGS